MTDCVSLKKNGIERRLTAHLTYPLLDIEQIFVWWCTMDAEHLLSTCNQCGLQFWLESDLAHLLKELKSQRAGKMKYSIFHYSYSNSSLNSLPSLLNSLHISCSMKQNTGSGLSFMLGIFSYNSPLRTCDGHESNMYLKSLIACSSLSCVHAMSSSSHCGVYSSTDLSECGTATLALPWWRDS